MTEFVGPRVQSRPYAALPAAVTPAKGWLNFKKPYGYLAGETPGGITSVDGSPVSCLVRVFVRDTSGGVGFNNLLVASVQSGSPGTWRVDNLDISYRYDVIASLDGYNDVIMSNVQPLGYGESRIISPKGIVPPISSSPIVFPDPNSLFSVWDAASSGPGVVVADSGLTGTSPACILMVTDRFRDPSISGTYQFEVKLGPRISAFSQYAALLGVANSLANKSFYPGYDNNGFSYYLFNGQYYTGNNGYTMGYPAQEGDYIGIVLSTGGILKFYKNGVLQGTKTIPTSSPIRPAWGGGSTGSSERHTAYLNTGQSPFQYPIAGATAWH